MTNPINQSGIATTTDEHLPISGKIHVVTDIVLPDNAVVNDGYTSGAAHPINLNALLHLDSGKFVFEDFKKFLTIEGLRLYKQGERTGVIKGAFLKTIYAGSPKEKKVVQLDVEAADIDDFGTADRELPIGNLLPLAKKANGQPVLNLRELLEELGINYLGHLQNKGYINAQWTNPQTISDEKLTEPGYMGWLPIIQEAVTQKIAAGEEAPDICHTTFLIRDKGLSHELTLNDWIQLITQLSKPDTTQTPKTPAEKPNPVLSFGADIDLALGQENAKTIWQLPERSEMQIVQEGQARWNTKIRHRPENETIIESTLSPIKLSSVKINETEYILPLSLAYGLDVTTGEDSSWWHKTESWTTRWTQAFLNLTLDQSTLEIPKTKIGGAELPGIRFLPDSEGQGLHIDFKKGEVSSEDASLPLDATSTFKIGTDQVELFLPEAWVDALGISGLAKAAIVSGYQSVLGPTHIDIDTTVVSPTTLHIKGTAATETSGFLESLANLGINIPKVALNFKDISAHIRRQKEGHLELMQGQAKAEIKATHQGQTIEASAEIVDAAYNKDKAAACLELDAKIKGTTTVMGLSAAYTTDLDSIVDVLHEQRDQVSRLDAAIYTRGSLSSTDQSLNASYALAIDHIDATRAPQASSIKLGDLFSSLYWSQKNIVGSKYNLDAQLTLKDDAITTSTSNGSTTVAASPEINMNGTLGDNGSDQLGFDIKCNPSVAIAQEKDAFTIKEGRFPFSIKAQGHIAGIALDINYAGLFEIIDTGDTYTLTLKQNDNEPHKIVASAGDWQIDGTISGNKPFEIIVPKNNAGQQITVPLNMALAATVKGPQNTTYQVKTTLSGITTLAQGWQDDGSVIYLPKVGENKFELKDLSLSQIAPDGSPTALLKECALSLADTPTLFKLASSCQSVPGLSNLTQSVSIAGFNAQSTSTGVNVYSATPPQKITFSDFNLSALQMAFGKVIGKFSKLALDFSKPGTVPDFDLTAGSLILDKLNLPGFKMSQLGISNIQATNSRIAAQIVAPQKIVINQKVNGLQVSGELSVSGLSKVIIDTKKLTAKLDTNKSRITGDLTVAIPTKTGHRKLNVTVNQEVPVAAFTAKLKQQGTISLATISYKIPNIELKIDLNNSESFDTTELGTIDLAAGSTINLALSSLSGQVRLKTDLAKGIPEIYSMTGQLTIPDIKRGIIRLAGHPLFRSKFSLLGESMLDLSLLSQNNKAHVTVTPKGSTIQLKDGEIAYNVKGQAGMTGTKTAFNLNSSGVASVKSAKLSLSSKKVYGTITGPELVVDDLGIKTTLDRKHPLMKLFQLPTLPLKELVPPRDYPRERIDLAPINEGQTKGSTHRLPPVI